MDLCKELTAERKDVVVVGWEDTAKDTAIDHHDDGQAQSNCPKQVGVKWSLSAGGSVRASGRTPYRPGPSAPSGQ
jgi:hypothetical protein